MVSILLALAASAVLCTLLFFVARAVGWVSVWQGQRIFIRKTLAASPHAKNRRLIVSFSTLPDRIANLRPILECMLGQTRPPDEIFLAIPNFSVRQQRGYVIPSFLQEMPTVRVVCVERDWGPATKFIPALQNELAAGRADTAIIVLDDDRIYPRDTVESYLHWTTELPDAALCFRGAKMPRNFDWRVSEMTHGHRIRTPQRVAVVTGAGSYLIKPRFFDESLWDYSAAPEAAFYMDDIWISGCLDRRGIKKFVVPASAGQRHVKAQQRTMTLHEVPNGRQPNNNEVIAYFRDGWNVFAS
ncbi:MAG: glycosyltransferase family 2 protein [Verrucomicrobiota bacterium]|nr:glycosyltransferase family 2 protein [Verrucomicrobiota bacterium]MDQ6938920.1 glycosyltransferase family 2 protein [Verrucomicrobiota bacterium]